MPQKPSPGSLAEAMRKVAPYLNLGWTFAVTVLLAILAGWWLDRRYGTGPWLLLAGLVFGIVAAFVNFFRVVFPPKGKDGSR